MAQKKPRPANTRAHTVYKIENRWEKNKIRKMKKRLKEQPNNDALRNRLTDIEKNGATYNRNKVPKNHTWSPKDKWFAECKAKVTRLADHYFNFDRKGVDKTPTLPDWKKVLQKLQVKPKVHVKRRGHRRVRT